MSSSTTTTGYYCDRENGLVPAPKQLHNNMLQVSENLQMLSTNARELGYSLNEPSCICTKQEGVANFNAGAFSVPKSIPWPQISDNHHITDSDYMSIFRKDFTPPNSSSHVYRSNSVVCNVREWRANHLYRPTPLPPIADSPEENVSLHQQRLGDEDQESRRHRAFTFPSLISLGAGCQEDADIKKIPNKKLHELNKSTKYIDLPNTKT